MDKVLTRAVAFLTSLESTQRRKLQVTWRFDRIMLDWEPRLPTHPNHPMLILWLREPTVGRFNVMIPAPAISRMEDNDLTLSLTERIEAQINHLRQRPVPTAEVDEEDAEDEEAHSEGLRAA